MNCQGALITLVVRVFLLIGNCSKKLFPILQYGQKLIAYYARDIFPGVETLKNFYEVLYENKKLPKVIPTINEPLWTKAIPGIPYRIKVHLADNPPLFAWVEYENAIIKGDLSYLRELLFEKKYLQKHYEWIENLKSSPTPKGVLFPSN